MRKRITAFFILLCMIVSMCAYPAFATEGEEEGASTSGRNVGLVIDGSTSLTKRAQGNDPTDINGYRYEAINSLIDLLPSDYTVDAVVFCGNDDGTDNSDVAMTSGLRLNTKSQSIKSATDRENLKKSIIDAGVGNYTDIGTALLTVSEELKAQKQQNGLDCAIFLFTDGVTQMKSDKTLNKSLSNKEKAIEIIKNENMEMMGLFLNDQGKLQSTEVMDLVRRANGYADSLTETELKTSKRYLPITTNDDLLTANACFLDVLGLTPITFENEIDVSIPGYGIADMNIMVQAPLNVLQNCDVIITRPNTSVLSSAELNAVLSRGSTYEVFKITNPESGVWHISVKAPSDDVQLICSLLLNTDFSASIKCNDENIHAGMDVELSAWLNNDSGEIKNKEQYNEFVCQLRVVDAQTGESELIDMELMDEGGFYTTYHVNNYGTFYVDAVFTCGNYLSMHSRNMLTWIISNEAPSANETYEVTIPYGLFAKGTETVNCNSLVQDREDGIDSITCEVSLGEYNPDAVKQEDGKVIIDGKKGGNGEFTLVFTDSQGASDSTKVIITTKNVTPLRVILIAILIVIVLLGYFCYRFITDNNRTLTGEMDITLPFTDNYDVVKQVSITVPASCLKHKTLAEVMEREQSKQELRYIIKTELGLNELEDADFYVSKMLKTLTDTIKTIRFVAVDASNKKKARIKTVCRVFYIRKGKKTSHTFENKQYYISILDGEGNLSYHEPKDDDEFYF